MQKCWTSCPNIYIQLMYITYIVAIYIVRLPNEATAMQNRVLLIVWSHLIGWMIQSNQFFSTTVIPHVLLSITLLQIICTHNTAMCMCVCMCVCVCACVYTFTHMCTTTYMYVSNSTCTYDYVYCIPITWLSASLSLPPIFTRQRNDRRNPFIAWPCNTTVAIQLQSLQYKASTAVR